MKNYYQILGLDSNASKIEIKKAYRTYATKFHPDKQNGDKFFEERFKEILEAYEILIDDSKRANYDSKRTSDYPKGASAYNKQSNSKSESDLNRESEQSEQREKESEERKRAENIKQENERREIENEKRKKEEKLKKKRAKIYYTSKDISVNGLYIYKGGKSYLLDDYDSVALRKDDNSNFIFVGIVLIIVGILTIAFFIGALLLALGIYGLFYKEYFVVLVNEFGDIPLIKGRKQKMKRIVNKINQAKKEK